MWIAVDNPLYITLGSFQIWCPRRRGEAGGGNGRAEVVWICKWDPNVDNWEGVQKSDNFVDIIFGSSITPQSCSPVATILVEALQWKKSAGSLANYRKAASLLYWTSPFPRAPTQTFKNYTTSCMWRSCELQRLLHNFSLCYKYYIDVSTKVTCINTLIIVPDP